MSSRTFVTVFGATVLAAVGLFSTVSAAALAPAPPNGTGLYTCNHMTGKVTFSPAWSDTGTGTVTATLTFAASRCSGGSPAPTRVTSKLVGDVGIVNAGTQMSLAGRVSGSYPSHLIGGEFLGSPKGNCSKGLTSDALHQSSEALVDY
jgi:hypothetical protein